MRNMKHLSYRYQLCMHSTTFHGIEQQYLNPSLEGGAEHERLPVGPCLPHDRPHLVLEPHVEHAVGLIQNLEVVVSGKYQR